ncbi:MAG: DUF4476 domain-containing protein [Chitinophagales bacterium]|nr:DUF4476 domain-containing protein [Chitinophagales bacterium]
MKKVLTLSLMLFIGIATYAAGTEARFDGRNNTSKSSMTKTNKSSSQNKNSNSNKSNNSNNWSSNNNNYTNGHSNTKPTSHVKTQVVKPVVRPVVTTVVRPVVRPIVRPVVVTQPVIRTRPLININVNRPVYTTPVRTTTTLNYPAFSFNDLIYSLENQRYESDRLSVARQAIAENRLDTYQILQIMTLFDYEESRLTIAKDAYYACLDRENYYRVNDMLKFSSSVRDLEDYIWSVR